MSLHPLRNGPVLRRGVAALAAGTLAAAGLLGVSDSATAASPGYLSDPAALVNPLIGTSGAVDDFPGADVPFGMVQWSPDTPSSPAGGGYEYNDTSVTGFSLTHISGPGCGAAGDIPILPTTGAVPADPSTATLPLDHADESAQAGRYSLSADGITTNLTTTLRSGMAQFSYPAGSPANLLFKLSDSQNGTTSTHFQVVNDHEVAGWVTSGMFCGASDTYNVYFDMTFDQPFTSYGTWTNSSSDSSDSAAAVHRGATSLDRDAAVRPTTRSDVQRTEQEPSSNHTVQVRPTVHGTTKRSGTGTHDSKADATPADAPTSGEDGAYLTFPSTVGTVQAKVGLSYVSTANAKKNRTAENPGWNFGSVAQAAHNDWNAMLNKIQIAGGTTTQQQIFETALYHSLLHPNVFSDVNGQYTGADGQVHTMPKGHADYTNYSGWDIYRSQVQLASLVAPQQTSDSIRSMLADYAQTGQLPKWMLDNGESYVMVGDPADPIIADAYAFGAKDFSATTALKDMQTEANTPNDIRPGLDYYEDDGYLPLDGTYGCCNFYGPVSTQQEYNTADYAISSMAKALGKTSVAQQFATRANNWQNVFNPATGYLEAKYADGRFVTGFTPDTSTGFVEGTSAQYTPMEPFDIAGLAAADGGDANWVAKLDALSQNFSDPGPLNANFGNEPSLEIPWEYDYVGAPYKTQQVIREIQQSIYTDQPAGIAGNDDLGAMSSWYVFSALGMYPETPGTADLALGSAVFPKARIHLPTGRTLTITAPNASASTPYITSMTVNGDAWNGAYLPSSLVSKGGTVVEQLSSSPNTSFAAKTSDAPPSDRTGLDSALGFTQGTTTVVAPGSTGTLTIGAQNLVKHRQQVTWTATGSNGLGVSPSSGTLLLPKGGQDTQQLTLTAPATEGRYDVTIDYRSGSGTQLPPVVTEIDVAKPGELWPYYNNAGIASDGQSSAANYDGDGYAYSEQQLAAAGLGDGQTKTIGGISYTMPDEPAGQPDNIETGGQTVPFSATGAKTIGFLGSSTNGSPGVTSTATVHYADGSSSQIPLDMTDWTYVGGQYSAPSYGNGLAASMTYRDSSGGSNQQLGVYLFTATAALTGTSPVTSITFPSSSDAGQLHVFAIGTSSS